MPLVSGTEPAVNEPPVHQLAVEETATNEPETNDENTIRIVRKYIPDIKQCFNQSSG
jgi:hypothetical protein